MTAKCSEAQIAERLHALKAWERAGDRIEKRFEFVNFVAALGFVDRVGLLAEAAGHHPDIDIRYNRVRLALSTCSAGGLTAKDFDLAAQIDALQED